MKTYKNPFALKNQWSENECGDPFIMRFNGQYYLYCSSAGDHIKCWISEDLVEFSYVGSVCNDPIIAGAYAPEVCYFKGKFYMITSPVGSGHYLLEAEQPTGPFHLISDNLGLAIDGSFFVDDDGKQYMLRAGHHGIVIHSMPSPKEIDINGDLIPESYLNHWTEGPMIIKRNGYYYLTYTGNHLLSKGYRIEYSVSKESPASGYFNLKNHTLLLETGHEFHALGHSSSFLAPDLDSYCIAYHNFYLDNKPKKRSTNIDRLFFNGARMYCNPIWWEQTAHKMPEFFTRGREILTLVSIKDKDYLIIPVETECLFTAEINVNPNGNNVKFLYSYKNSQYGCINLNNNYTYEIIEYDTGEKGIHKKTGTISDAICFNSMLTLRIASKSDSLVDVYVNNLFLCSFKTDLQDGHLGILNDENLEIGYIGYSKSVEGSEDKYAYKAIPGRFDAIHCKEPVETKIFKESGFDIYSAVYRKGESYTYKVNVKETGRYKVLIRVSGNQKDIGLKVKINESETILNGELSQICDDSGYEMIALGTIELPEGLSEVSFNTEQEELIIDYFELVKDFYMPDTTVVKDGNLACDINVLGHKGQKSMIHKYSGFTCAENFGMAFIGEDGLSDYSVFAKVNRNHKPTGDVSILLRVRKESWFHAQVKESFYGYRVKVTFDGIYLYRVQYGEELLAFYVMNHWMVQKIEINIRIEQSVLTVNLYNEPVIVFFDPYGYLVGKIGMEATGDGFGFEEFTITNN